MAMGLRCAALLVLSGCWLIMISCEVTIKGKPINTKAYPYTYTYTYTNTNTIYIAGFLGQTTAARTAVDLAIEDVTNASILGDYRLEVVWNPTDCDMATATRQLFEAFHDGPTKLLLLCCACPLITGPIAEIARAWGTIQMSYADTSALLSDKHKYANFFRLIPSEVDFNPARLRLLEQFGWQKVGIISLDPSSGNQQYAMTYNKLIKLLEIKNFTMKGETIIDDFNRIRTVVAEFKEEDYRVFIGLFDEKTALKVFCAAYQYGLYGAKYVWIVPSGYSTDWWRKQRKIRLPCSESDLLTAVNGYFSTAIQLLAPGVGVDNDKYRSAEYERRYKARLGGASTVYDPYHAYAYDTIWTIAFALQKIIKRLQISGVPASNITELLRNDSILINRTLNSLDFAGVTGRVQFSQGERIGTIDYFQFQTSKLIKVGEYVAARHALVASDNAEFFWHGKECCPKADVVRTIEEQYINLPMFIVISSVAVLGVIFAIFLICVNIRFRKHRFIKMSSPNMNNLIILGCCMAYVSVILLGLDGRYVSNDSLVRVCMARTWILTTSFTLAFGAMFTKTWRVHAIFTNIKMNKKVMKDYQLIGTVFAFLLVDVVMLTLWAVIDPLSAKQQKLGQITSYRDNKEYLITPVVSYCDSEKMKIWMSLVFLYKGCLLIIGVFFAWETRRVSIPALNDSRYIGMSVYNVVIMCLSGASISFIVDSSYFNAIFVIMSTFIIFSTSITLCFIFIPKLIELKRDPKGQEKRVRATLVKSKKVIHQDNFDAQLKKTIDDNFTLKKTLDQKLNELQQLTRWCDDPDYLPNEEQLLYLLEQPSSTSPTTTTEIADEVSQSQSQSMAQCTTTASRLDTETTTIKESSAKRSDYRAEVEEDEDESPTSDEAPPNRKSSNSKNKYITSGNRGRKSKVLRHQSTHVNAKNSRRSAPVVRRASNAEDSEEDDDDERAAWLPKENFTKSLSNLRFSRLKNARSMTKRGLSLPEREEVVAAAAAAVAVAAATSSPTHCIESVQGLNTNSNSSMNARPKKHSLAAHFVNTQCVGDSGEPVVLRLVGSKPSQC